MKNKFELEQIFKTFYEKNHRDLYKSFKYAHRLLIGEKILSVLSNFPFFLFVAVFSTSFKMYLGTQLELSTQI